MNHIVLGWISISIWIGIYLPLSLVGLILFYKHRFVTAIAKRHVTMTLVVLLFCLCHICVDRVLWIVFICNISTSLFLNMTSIFSYPIFLYGILFSLLWRFWIIRYDIQFARASMNQKWRSIINEEMENKQNWWLSNKSKWGNTKFIASYIIVPIYLFCIILSIIIRFQVYNPSRTNSTTLHTSDYLYFWIIDLAIAMMPYCVIVYLWCKTPSFNDTFWIHDASKLIFIVLFVLFVADLTSGIIAYLNLESDQFVYLSLIESHIICAANFTIIMIMTFCVFYKNRASFMSSANLQTFLFKNTPTLTLAPTDSVNTHQSNKAAPKKAPTSLSLKAVLKDPMLFHTFMSHLATEFSMECLLAIVEFTEYQQYCMANFKDYLSSKHDYQSHLLQLPSNIPQSLIVYGSIKKAPQHWSAAAHARIITPMMHNLSLRLNRSASAQSANKRDSSQEDSESGKPSNSPKASPSMNTLCSPNPLASTLTDSGGALEIVTIQQKHSIPSQLCLERAHSDTGVPSLLLGTSSGNNSNSKSKKRQRAPSKGVYGELKPFQTKAKLLYEKYIEVGAEYEINISYDLRNSFSAMLDNDELWSSVFEHNNRNRNKLQNEKIISDKLHQILTLLDTSIMEMLKLLAHSFARFKKTNTYEKLLRIHKYS